MDAQPRGDKDMTRATKEAKAASNTYIKMIPDTLAHFDGRYGLDDACSYLDGYLAPHYPVPAIQTRVMWGRRKGWITIAERGSSNMFHNVKTWRPVDYLKEQAP